MLDSPDGQLFAISSKLLLHTSIHILYRDIPSNDDGALDFGSRASNRLLI